MRILASFFLLFGLFFSAIAQTNPDSDPELQALLANLPQNQDAARADSLNKLYKLLVKRKNYPQALEYAQQEAAIRQNLPQDSVQIHRLANLYFGLGSINRVLGAAEQGLVWVEKSIKGYQQLSFSRPSVLVDLDLSDAYRMQAQMYVALHRPTLAEKAAKTSLQIAEKHPKEGQERQVNALILLANISSIVFHFEEASAYLEQALSLQNRLSPTENEITARIHQSLAYNHDYQSDRHKAKIHLQHALRIRQGLYPNGDNLDLAHNHKALAGVETKLHNYASAKRQLRAGLEIYRNLLGDRNSHIADMLALDGEINRVSGRIDLAEVCFKQALELYQDAENPLLHRQLETLIALSQTVARGGDSLKAVKYAQQGLQLSQSIPDLSSYEAGCWWELFENSPDHRQRDHYARQAILKSIYSDKIKQLVAQPQSWPRQNLETLHQELYLSCADKNLFSTILLAYLDYSNRYYPEDIARQQELIQWLRLGHYFNQQELRKTVHHHDKARKNAYAGSLYRAGLKICYRLYHHYQDQPDLADYYFDLGLNCAEWAKDWQLPQQIGGNNEQPALQSRYKEAKFELLHKEEQLQLAARKQQIKQELAEVIAAQEQVDSLAALLYQLSPNTQGLLSLNSAVLSKSLLYEGRVLLAFSAESDGVHRFEIGRNSRIWSFQPCPFDSLAGRLSLLYSRPNGAPDSLFALVKLSAELGKILLSRLDTNYKELIISPDEGMSSLPLEALFYQDFELGAGGLLVAPFWVKKAAFSYLHSLQMWAWAWSRTNQLAEKSQHTQLLAIRPDYGKAASDSSRQRLQPLFGATEEVEFLQAMLKGGFLIGASATEKKSKELLPKYQIIHFAGHGELNLNYPSQSRLILAHTADSAQNSFANEGYLHLYEVAAMNLNARLVFLSACETAGGLLLSGEGVFSLSKGFSYAGVPATIGSYWEVNDGSTHDIAKLFYQQLGLGTGKNRSLQQAKISYLDRPRSGLAMGLDPAHPYFWAAFNLYGDIAPLVPQPAPNQSLWLLVKILAFVLGFWVFLKVFRTRKNANK